MAKSLAARLIRELLNPYSPYYSGGYLNSEGLTALRLIAREVLRDHPWLRGRLARARARREYWYVSKVLSEVLEVLEGQGEVSHGP